jgi:hypothetical protein
MLKSVIRSLVAGATPPKADSLRTHSALQSVGLWPPPEKNP